jgi:hypothetical protein
MEADDATYETTAIQDTLHCAANMILLSAVQH